MKVAIVGGGLPYPPNSGARIRTLNLTLRLAASHEITYIHHADGLPETEEAATFLRDHGVQTHGVAHAVPSKRGAAFHARLAANLVSRLPYSVETHVSPSLRRGIETYAESHPVNLWQAEGSPYSQAIGGLLDARKVVMAHNVESLIWERYHETERRAARRWYIARQWRKFERFERRAFAEATRVVTVSEEDAELVRSRFGVDRVEVVANGIDRDYFAAVVPDREARRVLFLGSLDWRPNLDAVGLLLDEIFPAVLAAEPSAGLDLVGRNPPDDLRRRVREMPHVELHADVPDVRPFLGRCLVMAVPLRIGGGSRLKILESLAAGLPVVSTRVGAEGLRLTPGRDLVVVERVEEMASALLSCFREPDACRAMADRGRELVLERYDWDILSHELGGIWERCLAEPVSGQIGHTIGGLPPEGK